ncbi:acyl-CoA thioesterase [Motiliproteus sp.]|uniref:acyl-CoA thioesterase n=1 Tax=Motiliproteus sp. TaxID=1898955 RepID=UPI003BA9FBAF
MSPSEQNWIPSSRTLAMPADTNANGDIFGGWLMSQMDIASGSFAAKEAGGPVVTVAVDGMTFHKPVKVGDELSCYCQVERIGTSSIKVKVESWVTRYHSHHEEKVTEACFTFVAIDSNGHPRPITRF